MLDIIDQSKNIQKQQNNPNKKHYYLPRAFNVISTDALSRGAPLKMKWIRGLTTSGSISMEDRDERNVFRIYRTSDAGALLCGKNPSFLQLLEFPLDQCSFYHDLPESQKHEAGQQFQYVAW